MVEESEEDCERLLGKIALMEKRDRVKNKSETEPETGGPESQGIGELRELLQEHAKLVRENTEEVSSLSKELKERRGTQPSYAAVLQQKPSPKPRHAALHSVVVTSEVSTDTSEEVLDRLRRAVDAKEGWVTVERVRKVRDQKVVVSCPTEEDRRKVRERVREVGERLVAEDMANKDPLLILRDVLVIHSDEEVIRALRNQNKGVFQDLGDKEQRLQVRFRKKTRNPHTNHLVLSTSPKVWQRATEAGALYVDLQRIRVSDHSPLVQCSRCLGYGHSRRHCTDKDDLCSQCGGPHRRTECAGWRAGDKPSCVNCKRAGLAKCDHNAFGDECPVRAKWDALARASVAYC